MNILTVTIVIYSLLLLWIILRKDDTLAVCLTCISLGSILNQVISNSTTYFVVAIAVIKMATRIFQRKMRKNTLVISIMTLVALLFLLLFNQYSTDNFIYGMYELIVLPFLCFDTIKNTKNKNRDFIDGYSIYIFVGFIIQFYRVLFDYTFFGLAVNTDIYQNYSSIFMFGSASFRPSSLLSPIIFGIEVVIANYLLILKYGFKKRVCLFAIISAVSLYLMRSRSSIILLFLLCLILLIKVKGKIKLAFLPLTLVFMISMFVGERFNILEILTFKDESYSIRFSSIENELVKFVNDPVNNIIFGKGIGTANKMIEGTMEYYVEDFFIALLIDLGITGFLILGAIVLKAIRDSFYCRKAYLGLLLIGLLVVNLFASNLSSFVIQILFWVIICYCYNPALFKQRKTFDWIEHATR